MFLPALLNQHRGLLLPISILACIGILLVPLPPAAMDILLAANIAVAILILLTTISIKTPLEFSAFPSLLVATTLARLVLNVGTTRLILTRGSSQGERAAGGMIQSFGEFVAGDMLIVGIVIFAIIAAIQFLVITKGATRVGEVAARFALDGMPGRQMAIDADLNAGLITGEQAQQRREDLVEQADFYGAMDGASKFVRGDAIASILITFINIVGGLAIGLSSGMSIQDAGATFTTLTIGDGLVSQIPAFLISLGAALLVTRSQRPRDLSNDFLDQLFSHPQTLAVAGGFLVLLVFTNLPTIPLLVLGGACVGLSVMLSKQQKLVEQKQMAAAEEPQEAPTVEPTDYLHVDAIRIELGRDLLRIASQSEPYALMDKISTLRAQVAQEMGFLIPKVRLKDNLELAPNEYRILLSGNVLLRERIQPDMLLAVAQDLSSLQAVGLPADDGLPFGAGLSTRWVPPEIADRIQDPNVRLLWPSQVVAARLGQIVGDEPRELLSREHTKQLLHQLQKTHSAVVEELIPDRLSLGDVQRVLQQLLAEGIPIRQLGIICEALSDAAGQTQDISRLVQVARERLARTISQRFAAKGQLDVLTLSPQLDQRVVECMDFDGSEMLLSMPPGEVEALCHEIGQTAKEAGLARPVVLVRPKTRAALRALTEHRLPDLVVLSFAEITGDVHVHALGTVEPSRIAA